MPRLISLMLFFLLVPVALGFAAGGVAGTVVGATVGAACFIWKLLTTERAILRSLGPLTPLPAGLVKSFRYATMDLGIAPSPRLFLLPHATPNVLVGRGPRSPGFIVLTQGLVALLDEQELRATLRLALFETRRPGLLIRSFSAALGITVFRLAPRAWIGLIGAEGPSFHNPSDSLNARSTIRFLLVVPLLRFLILASRRDLQHFLAGYSVSDEWGRATASALQKISHSAVPGVLLESPAVSALFLLDPWPDQALLPI